MAVLATFTVRGNTEKLLERLDAAMPRIMEVSSGKPLSHVAVPAGEGIKVYDVWESEEALGEFAQNPDFHRVLREAGLPEPEVEVKPVHRFGW